MAMTPWGVLTKQHAGTHAPFYSSECKARATDILQCLGMGQEDASGLMLQGLRVLRYVCNKNLSLQPPHWGEMEGVEGGQTRIRHMHTADSASK